MQDLYLLGYSGHAYVVIEALDTSKFCVKGYFTQEQCLENPYNLEYCGTEMDKTFKERVGEGYAFPAIGSNRIREIVISILNRHSINQINVISPTATLSPTARIGLSNFISNSAVLNARVKIGNGCIINTGAIVEHECRLKDFVHIAPGCVIAGNVQIGYGSFIGANAVVRQNVKIGDYATIGAGAVVVCDVPDGETWVGNPAKPIIGLQRTTKKS